MKICERGLNFIQIIDMNGELRICGWLKGGRIGSLLEQDLYSIYHGKEAERVRKPLIDGTYSDCPITECPYLANGTITEHCIEIDEVPDYPSELYLAYQGICNYRCTCCTSHMHMIETANGDWEDNYNKIEDGIKDVLPNIKRISANGRGELFCSPRILKLLSEWKPISPINEISVNLETNGSLFNEKNWAKISNLGQYNLEVCVTVMSFNEKDYQYLSGTRLPIDNILNNLRFMKKLREEGVINYLEIATVMQERNFREMPEFSRRCIEEFGADIVRIRAIQPGGPLDSRVQWFMDVRNPYHPYYDEYKEVMEHEIFNNPKVIRWSGDTNSSDGTYPADRELKYASQIQAILMVEDLENKLMNFLDKGNVKDIWLYGITPITESFIKLLQIRGIKQLVGGVLDKYSRKEKIDKIEVKNPMYIEPSSLSESIIVTTVFGKNEEIEKDLRYMRFDGKILSMDHFINQAMKCECCK